MGERFRLKASFDISSYPPEVQVILRGMKKYGIILADNGSAWYISGKPDPRWNDNNLHQFSRLLGSNFEAVDATVLRIDANSGAAIQNGTVTVTPTSTSVRIGHLQAFVATTTGAPGGVSWSVNGIPGGNAMVGTIDSSGQYLPPASVPNPAVVTVRATSVAAVASSGSASVTILPLPTITSVSPASVVTGSFALTVDGVGFVAGSLVTLDGAPLTTAFVSPTRLTATGTAQTPTSSVAVTVRTPDGEVSNTVWISVVASAPVSIAISPTSARVRVRRTKQFSANVQGASNTSAIWTVNGIVGGNASVGTISQTGLYGAPSTVPRPSTVTVSATAAADPSKAAAASVTITKR